MEPGDTILPTHLSGHDLYGKILYIARSPEKQPKNRSDQLARALGPRACKGSYFYENARFLLPPLPSGETSECPTGSSKLLVNPLYCKKNCELIIICGGCAE